jgi:hypothetical protein
MEKNKYDFISELLEQKKLDPSQKERFLNLVSQEFKNDFSSTEEFENRLKAIETKLEIEKPVLAKITEFIELVSGAVLNEDKSEKASEQEVDINEKDNKNIIPSNTPKYFYPSSLYKFLFEFNQNQILKSTCHEIDANALEVILEYCGTDKYDFQLHYKKILSAYEEHEKKSAPPSIKALIRGYLTGKDYYGNDLKHGWSSDKINTTWNNKQLSDWSIKNINLSPNSIEEDFLKNKIDEFELLEHSFTSKINGKRVQTFRELVLHFKSLFHIRYGEDSLHQLILNHNSRDNFNDRIEFEINEEFFPKNIELFTDVDKLLQAYKKIIELIIEQHPKDSKPKVKLAFYEVDSYVYFSIHHLNNSYNKTIQNTIDRMGQTYTNLINKQINGLCNLYVNAEFSNEGYASINLWNDMKRMMTKSGLEDFNGGVEHILQFCR